MAWHPDGFELWRGASRLNGAPIVVVVTHLRRSPLNRKIGDMAQAWILPQDIAPNDALRDGSDAAVCGDCRFRPANGGGCYVSVPHTAQRVWWAWHEYRSYRPVEEVPGVGEKPMRIGAWGDPMAVPATAWAKLFAAGLSQWTAYTSQWATAEDAERSWWQRWCMASVKTVGDQAEAERQGWRTYRTRTADQPLLPNEIVCLAAEESLSHGRSTCASCHLCDGVARRKRRNIAIIVHGRRSTQAERGTR
jgi:hypothetical protein